MSGTIVEDSRDQVLADCPIKNDVEGEGSFKDTIDSDVGDENAVPSPEEEVWLIVACAFCIQLRIMPRMLVQDKDSILDFV